MCAVLHRALYHMQLGSVCGAPSCAVSHAEWSLGVCVWCSIVRCITCRMELALSTPRAPRERASARGESGLLERAAVRERAGSAVEPVSGAAAEIKPQELAALGRHAHRKL